MLKAICKCLLLITISTFVLPSMAQEGGHRGIWDLHIYRAGVITSIGYVVLGNSDKELSMHLGYNKTNRKDFGSNETESGGGPGLSVQYVRNYEHWFKYGFMGARIDYWLLNIDWTNAGISGSTTVNVLQPTLEIGCEGAFDENLDFRASAAAGYEINLFKRGQAVGQGAIGLLRFALIKRF